MEAWSINVQENFYNKPEFTTQVFNFWTTYQVEVFALFEIL